MHSDTPSPLRGRIDARSNKKRQRSGANRQRGEREASLTVRQGRRRSPSPSVTLASASVSGGEAAREEEEEENSRGSEQDGRSREPVARLRAVEAGGAGEAERQTPCPAGTALENARGTEGEARGEDAKEDEKRRKMELQGPGEAAADATAKGRSGARRRVGRQRPAAEGPTGARGD
ncbi:hypothetical protein BESB_069600 [Besnoitia besnoiti]|uniref:Uncharacterized protein n=1 Tax=Besnoitia besnoiti TaxID=94643 RepID=A0A2A9MH59_BESBE|nr:hypothetical protein BESB_069600 [Besnoitia besnoiti]PFH34927.1 hypothetical protein BESB_069600 [Besnoitia besnoiti]